MTGDLSLWLYFIKVIMELMIIEVQPMTGSDKGHAHVHMDTKKQKKPQ